MPVLPDGVPLGWAVILIILFLLFGGGGGIVWLLRRDIRESRQAPALEEQTRLANEAKAAEIAAMLRQEVSQSMAEMRQLLADARAESAAAKAEAAEARSEATQLRLRVEELQVQQATFRARVEQWFADNRLQVPEWWHQQP